MPFACGSGHYSKLRGDHAERRIPQPRYRGSASRQRVEADVRNGCYPARERNRGQGHSC